MTLAAVGGVGQGMSYRIRPTPTSPETDSDFDGPAWRHADTLELSHFHERSSHHRPRVQAKVLYDPETLHLFYRVNDDRYIRAVHTEYQTSVCRDSCVEFFVEPRPDRGYFNFELNCGGTMLVHWVEDPHLVNKNFSKYTVLPEAFGNQVRIYPMMPRRIDPELPGPLTWTMRFSIPVSVFEPYVGAIGALAGQRWRANFYKCADQTSGPHWAAWSPVKRLNFHQPQHFGELEFASR